MKKVILTAVISILSMSIQAQTFVCTDVKYYSRELTPEKIQRMKAESLGSKATLAFYDNCLKFSTIDKDGKAGSVVLDKVNKNKYQYVEKDRLSGEIWKLVIILNKWIEYIHSITVEEYKNNSLEVRGTMKRD